jgi:hypothetical protein
VHLQRVMAGWNLGAKLVQSWEERATKAREGQRGATTAKEGKKARVEASATAIGVKVCTYHQVCTPVCSREKEHERIPLFCFFSFRIISWVYVVGT